MLNHQTQAQEQYEEECRQDSVVCQMQSLSLHVSWILISEFDRLALFLSTA